MMKARLRAKVTTNLSRAKRVLKYRRQRNAFLVRNREGLTIVRPEVIPCWLEEALLELLEKRGKDQVELEGFLVRRITRARSRLPLIQDCVEDRELEVFPPDPRQLGFCFPRSNLVQFPRRRES